MFIVYGNKNTRIGKEFIQEVPCSSCKKFDLEATIYRKNFHVWFIPFYMGGRWG